MDKEIFKKYLKITGSVLLIGALIFLGVYLFTPKDKANASDLNQSLNGIESILASLSDKDFSDKLNDSEIGLASNTPEDSKKITENSNVAGSSKSGYFSSSSSQKNALEYAIVENEINSLLQGLDDQFDNSQINDGNLGI